MKRMQVAVVLGAALVAPVLVVAQAPANGGVTVWTKGTPPKDGVQREEYGNHLMYVSTRKENGKVEVHKTQADILIIQKGEADFLSGGEGVGMVATSPNELLGPSMKGGVKVHLGPGDVIHVPVGVAHQFLIKPGTEMTYLIVKVTKP